MPAEPRLNLLVLRTVDVDRLRSFYALIGLTFRQEQHGTGPVHYSAASGGATLEIYPATAAAPPDTSTRVGFAAADVSRTCDALRAAGHPIRSEPRASEWGVRAVTIDPDGRSVELLQEDAPAVG